MHTGMRTISCLTSLVCSVLSSACAPGFMADQTTDAELCYGPVYTPTVLPAGVQRSLFLESLSLFTAPPADGDVQKLAVQRDVEPGKIVEERIARLHGQVADRNGKPMPCVRVSVVGHDEFGYTQSRDDGRFDLAVNDGFYVLRYERMGYLPVQRNSPAPALHYQQVPDVIMTPVVGPGSPITLGATQVQVARGAVESDASGSRQATLLFMPGTHAYIRLRDGTQREASMLNVRALEYTVGPRGQGAMPGTLPPTSAYTYAVELAADEVLNDPQATGVEFDQPVYVYVDGFLDFSVGAVVPSGYYDEATAEWHPSDNGRVVKILAVSDGKVDLDVTGAGKSASPDSLRQLGITPAELSRLAALGYPAGKKLWRVPVRHFTPWDFNWPYGAPPGAIDPPAEKPVTEEDRIQGICNEYPGAKTVKLDSNTIVDCEDLTLRLSIPVAGSNSRLSIAYSNNRQPGSAAGGSVYAPLVAGPIPSSLREIQFEVNVQGRQLRRSYQAPFPPMDSIPWDGLDWSGNKVYGSVSAAARVSYSYDPYYYETKEAWEQQFGRFPSQVYQAPVFSAGRVQIALHRYYPGLNLHVRRADTSINWLGGFTVSAFHTYNRESGYVYLGDGRLLKKDIKILKAFSIERYAGTAGMAGNVDGASKTAKLNSPTALALGNNADPLYSGLYVADRNNCLVRLIHANTVKRFAGQMPNPDCNGVNPVNGLYRLDAKLSRPSALAFGPDQTVAFSLPDQGVVQVVNLQTRGSLAADYVYTVAGNGSASGGSGSAQSVGIGRATGLAVGTSLNSTAMKRRLTIYISGDRDVSGTRVPVVQRVEVDAPQAGMSGARWEAEILAAPADIVLQGTAGSDFSALALADHAADATPSHVLYVTDSGMGRSQVRRLVLTATGIQSDVRIAGTGQDGWDADGPDAARVRLNRPQGLTLSPDGQALYIADTNNHIVRRLTKPESMVAMPIDTIAGTGAEGNGCDDKKSSSLVALGEPVGLAATDSVIYIADRKNHTICSLQALENTDLNSAKSLIIPHHDPENNVTRFYYFSSEYQPDKGEYPGRHQKTTVANLNETDPSKAKEEFTFQVTWDTVSQLPTQLKVEDKLATKRFEFTADQANKTMPIVIKETSTFSAMNASRVNGYLSVVDDRTSGTRWNLTFMNKDSNATGLLQSMLLESPTRSSLKQDFNFDEAGRLQRVTIGSSSLSLSSRIR